MAQLKTRPVRVTEVGGVDASPLDVVPGDADLRLLGSGRATLRPDPSSARKRNAAVTVLLEALPRTEAGTVRAEVVLDGWRFELEIEDAGRAELRRRASRNRGARGRGGPTELRAIIPGRVISVAVAPGDSVEVGHDLIVIEAMKMQNELRAPRAGVVERVTVGPGQTVDLGDLLVVLR